MSDLPRISHRQIEQNFKLMSPEQRAKTLQGLQRLAAPGQEATGIEQQQEASIESFIDRFDNAKPATRGKHVSRALSKIESGEELKPKDKAALKWVGSRIERLTEKVSLRSIGSY